MLLNPEDIKSDFLLLLVVLFAHLMLLVLASGQLSFQYQLRPDCMPLAAGSLMYL